MRVKPELYFLITLLVAGCASGGGEATEAPAAAPAPAAAAAPAPEPAAPGGAMTTNDGVYTAAQADRGAEVARTVCFACHSESEWTRPMFLGAWNGRPIAGLVGLIEDTMPYDSPGSLSDQEYADIVAYILELNGVAAGSTELPSDQSGLGQITITRN